MKCEAVRCIGENVDAHDVMKPTLRAFREAAMLPAPAAARRPRE